MIKPGDLSGKEEDFETRLLSRRKAQRTLANHADQRCSGRDGLSCPDVETLEAMNRVNLLPSFSSFACSHR